jgi:Flp pilus assembly protein TadG
MKMPHFSRTSNLSGPGPVGGPPQRQNLPTGRFILEKVCRLCRKNRRGAAAVEFAVVAPVLFLLVFGMIEFGRMVMVQQVITNGSREGARLAVLDGTTTADVTTAVNTYLTGASVQGATVTVTPNPPTSAAYGAPVTVVVSVSFDQVSWLPTPMFLSGRELTATTVMRRETIQ